jgi:hypothetical protein
MTIHYDEKGKIFSDIVRKTDVRATIQTIFHRIDGRMFVAPNERPKDALNAEEGFLAVADATVFDADGNKLYRADFIAVNRSHIIWVIPHEVAEMEAGRQTDDAA